jgi:cell division protein FtsW (lipid II flippase)
MDKWLLFWTVFMYIIGLFMIFSASSVEASLTGSPYYYFVKQALTLAMSAVAFIIVVSVPLKFYKRTAFLFVIGILGALIAVYLYGAIINKARSWIPLGFYNFQPSEFAKTAIILYMAVYYNKHKDSKNIVVILIPLFAAIAMCALIFIQPDFGTTSIIVAITAAIFFSVPFDKNIKKVILQFAALAIGVGLLFIFATGTTILRSGQMQRFDYKNPCSKYLTGGTGYQVCNGFIAINNGGLWGVGIGNSTQKYLYLPAAHTDFIFAIILEEMGLVASLDIILIYVGILILIMRIAFRSRNLMGSIIAFGTALYMFCHIAINLIGLLGLGPLTGVPLPFLSYGGSYALNLAILLALVQRVEIENKKKLQEKMLREGKSS